MKERTFGKFAPRSRPDERELPPFSCRTLPSPNANRQLSVEDIIFIRSDSHTCPSLSTRVPREERFPSNYEVLQQQLRHDDSETREIRLNEYLKTEAGLEAFRERTRRRLEARKRNSGKNEPPTIP